MSISDTQFTEWLYATGVHRNTLVRASVLIDTAETVKKLSTKIYNDYEPCIIGGLQYSETLNTTMQVSLAAGTIEIANVNGLRDSWLYYVWDSRDIEILIGDLSWAEADYRTVLKGTITTIKGSGDRNKLTLVLQDKLQRLNAPITSITMGSGPNTDTIIPFILGECCNITPVMLNENGGSTGTAVYRMHPLPFENVIEVRADEIPISFAADYTNGTFSPTYTPIGAVTLSVQGHKHGGVTGVYSDKIAELSRWVAITGGKDETRFTDADINLSNLTAFDTAYPYSMGYYGTSSDNVLSCINGLAASAESAFTVSRAGLMQVVNLVPTTPVKVVEHEILANTLTATTDKPLIKAAINLGYCKNWTVQTQAVSAVAKADQELFAKEWRNVIVSDAATKAKYKLHVTPTQEDTYIVDEASAVAEANRRLAFWKVPRYSYTFKTGATCMMLELGQTITLKAPRYTFSAGQNCVIIQLTFNWFDYTVQVGVLV